MNRLDGGSLDVEQMEMEKLRAVFPQCFVEGKLDIDKLLSMCGEYIDNDFEKYKFEWKGKSEALRMAQQRSMATLRPAVEESVDWDSTDNLYIEGDNLEVLKLLQTSYYNKVKMIYIDPPYNTGNDFVYEDDFKDSLGKYREITGQTTKSNPESMGRFHTNWLNMIYPRLRLASNLLTDDGVIFISIDDHEVHNLRKVCDEVFGEENFVAQFIWKSRQNKDNRNTTGVSVDHEYILCYSKNNLYRAIKGSERKTEQYKNPDNDSRGDWTSGNMVGLLAEDLRPNCHYDLINPATGINYGKPKMGWRYDRTTMSRLIEEDRILWPTNDNGRPRRKVFLSELSDNLAGFSSLVGDGVFTRTGTSEIDGLFGHRYFDYPKAVDFIKEFVNQATEKSNTDIILDFFSGSGTTAHAVMQLNAEDGGNRKFICVQLPEMTDEKSEAYKAGYKNICEIGKERIRRAGLKVSNQYVSDAAERAAKEGICVDLAAIDTGFKVFKLDSSNIKTWDATPTADADIFTQRMNEMIDTVKSDRTEMDVVYEVMLKMGVPLTYRVTSVDVAGAKVYSIGKESLLLVCLQTGLTKEMIEQMADDYIPAKIVLSEKCFADDTAMANAHYILKEREIELKLV
ncbi:MAG: site-specific DNA-methyltransferase [Rikenellaceae bacterium]